MWLIATLFSLMPFAWVDTSDDTQKTAVTIFSIIFLFFLVKTIQCFMAKLIIEEDHVTIKKWIIFKKVKDLKYKKINTIDVTYALWIGGIEIQMGNDKPIMFKNLENYNEVKSIINEKIDNIK